MFGNRKKVKYKIVFLRKEYKTMNVVKILNVKALKKIIKIGNKSFKIDYSFPSYNSGLNKIYFIDFESGAQMVFKNFETELNPEALDVIVGNKIIKEITSGVLDNKKQLLFYLFMGFLVGALLAALIVMVAMQGKVDKILSETTILPIPYLPTGISIFQIPKLLVGG